MYSMKNFTLIILLFWISNAIAQKQVTCGLSECMPGFSAPLYLEQANQTIIDAGVNNQDAITITLPANQEPRKLVFMVENNSLVGRDLTADLNSEMPEKEAEDFILIGDIFNNLNINLNGYTGTGGKDASQICADRFLDGTYGASSKTFFESRRSANAELSLSRCDETDVNHIQSTKFTCPDTDYVATANNNVQVQRIKLKQRCVGTSIRYKCVQRYLRLKCEWNGFPRGYKLVNKYNYYPCTNIWGGRNCRYDFNSSCWRGRDLSAAQNQGSSYPPDGTTPPWTIIFDNNRCDYVNQGGVFAYQQTDKLIERRYLDAVQSDSVSRLCQSDFPYPNRLAWRFNRVTEAYITQPGLDPDTLDPLPGSNWDVKKTDFFTPCSSLGLYDTLNSEIQTWTSFGDVGNNCSDARVVEDPNNLIPWTRSGTDQDPSFGVESFFCAPGNCPIQNLVREFDQNFDYIDPTIGSNGTNQGDGIILIYDSNNLVATARPGQAGNGGRNDIPNLKQAKSCVKIDDAVTKGIDSSFAREPIVNFNLYQWTGLKVNTGQPSGQPPTFDPKSIKIFKKIDSSVRYLIKQELVQ